MFSWNAHVFTSLYSADRGVVLLIVFIKSAGLRLIGMVFTFFIGVQLARGLGVEGFGIYSLIMSLVSILAIPSQSGLSTLIVKEVSKLKEETNYPLLYGVYKWACKLNLKIVFLIIGGCTALLNIKLFRTYLHLSESIYYPLGFGLLCLPLLGLLSINSALIRSMGNIVLGQSFEGFFYPILYSFCLFQFMYFICSELTPAEAMAMRVISLFVIVFFTFIMIFYNYKQKFLETIPIYESRYWRSNLLPFALSDGVRVLNSHLLTLILGLVTVSSEVGIFRIASSLLLFINLSITIISSMATPEISALFAREDYKQLEAKLRKYTFSMALPIALGVAVIFFFGDALIILSFGPEFTDARLPLLIMAGTTLISLIFGVGEILLNMTNNSKLVLKSIIISLLFMVLIMWPLLHYYGAVGAAISYSVGLISHKFILFYYGKALYPFKISILELSKLKNNK